MKPLLLTALVYLLLSGTPTASAQPADKTQRRQDVQELRTEIRAWFDRSVKPTLIEWKREYDASLSAEDLAALNILRAEAKAHNKHKKHDGVGKDARKASFERLKPIAERSKEKLRSIFDKGEGDIERWLEEGKEIFDAWQDSHPNAKRRFDPYMGRHSMPFGPGHGHMGRNAAIRFMLFDYSLDEQHPTMQGAMTTSPLRIAPLPAEGIVALEMDDMPNGPATVDVYTMDGNLVKSVPVTISGNTLDTTIDVSSLPTGTYMASVNTTSGRRTSQIVVSR